MIDVAGGVCDCGDSQGWKASGFCNSHRGLTEDEDLFKTLPQKLSTKLTVVIKNVLLYVLHILHEKLEAPNSDDYDEEPIIRRISVISSWLDSLAKRGDVCFFKIVLFCE